MNTFTSFFMRGDAKRTEKGFTLIELLVVIAIIGILASIVLASLNTARQKSRDARRIADVKQIQLALELFADGNSQEYPDTIAALVSQYIPVEPKDPSTQLSYSYDNLTNGAGCQLSDTAPCVIYHLGANLEDSNNQALDNDADVCAAVPAAGCSRALTGTTLSGIDGGGATPNDCIGTGGGVYCYDVTN
ncbi:type II secretion system protein [Candidatus Parcubacteria bacterium]|nr:MAG: type II secretion system protein [Candidatus Parcubacteria bacterium]